MHPVLAWGAGACVIGGATFVFGFAGFGIALVAMAFLPFLMSPATAVVLVTLYAVVFAAILLVPLRREARLGDVATLLAGTLAGIPFGVWALATLSASALSRLIGLVLLLVVLLEALGRLPSRATGRGWGLAAGALAGVMGGAVGTPGPPVILYSAMQGWAPRTVKANLQAFFVVNQGIILLGYWWTGLLTPEVGRHALAFAAPAILGAIAGVRLFDRVDPVRFRRVVFALLFLSGLALLVRG